MQMRMKDIQEVVTDSAPAVATVQKMVTDKDDGQQSRWMYWTDKGTWSFDILDAKTWSRSQIRYADKVAAKTCGAVVSMHSIF
jgi:hypothetical protein